MYIYIYTQSNFQRNPISVYKIISYEIISTLMLLFLDHNDSFSFWYIRSLFKVMLY